MSLHALLLDYKKDTHTLCAAFEELHHFSQLPQSVVITPTQEKLLDLYLNSIANRLGVRPTVSTETIAYYIEKGIDFILKVLKGIFDFLSRMFSKAWQYMSDLYNRLKEMLFGTSGNAVDYAKRDEEAAKVEKELEKSLTVSKAPFDIALPTDPSVIPQLDYDTKEYLDIKLLEQQVQQNYQIYYSRLAFLLVGNQNAATALALIKKHKTYQDFLAKELNAVFFAGKDVEAHLQTVISNTKIMLDIIDNYNANIVLDISGLYANIANQFLQMAVTSIPILRSIDDGPVILNNQLDGKSLETLPRLLDGDIRKLHQFSEAISLGSYTSTAELQANTDIAKLFSASTLNSSDLKTFIRETINPALQIYRGSAAELQSFNAAIRKQKELSKLMERMKKSVVLLIENLSRNEIHNPDARLDPGETLEELRSAMINQLHEVYLTKYIKLIEMNVSATLCYFKFYGELQLSCSRVIHGFSKEAAQWLQALKVTKASIAKITRL